MNEWATYQQRVINCIACRMGLPTRRTRYVSAGQVPIASRSRSRFNMALLASKLARALRRSDA